MESYQGIVMAECAVREHQERAAHISECWYLTAQDAPEPTLRETLAGALIGLARRLAPQHAAFAAQPR